MRKQTDFYFSKWKGFLTIILYSRASLDNSSLRSFFCYPNSHPLTPEDLGDHLDKSSDMKSHLGWKNRITNMFLVCLLSLGRQNGLFKKHLHSHQLLGNTVIVRLSKTPIILPSRIWNSGGGRPYKTVHKLGVRGRNSTFHRWVWGPKKEMLSLLPLDII